MKTIILLALFSFNSFSSSLEKNCLDLFNALNNSDQETIVKIMDEKFARCDYKVFSIPDSRLKGLKNNSSEFVGYQKLKNDLINMNEDGLGSLNKFRAWASQNQWEEFGPNHHFDWWMFPISDESSRGYSYTVLDQDIEALKKDLEYLSAYREGVRLMFKSWGWDIDKAAPIQDKHPKQVWRHYDVRLRKAVQSLRLFSEEKYLNSALKYVESLKNQGLISGQIPFLISRLKK